MPAVRGLEKDFAGRIDFVRVNILDEDNAVLMKQFGFSAAPELYLVDPSGKVLRFWDGAVGADELRKAFDIALRK